ncbi:MAG: hypothetical protein IIA53_08615 [Chloroflexi bacterium]|nr:hypothetical protein [Chloroflexota bacterium]
MIDINDFHDNIPHMFDFYSNHIISGYYRVLSLPNPRRSAAKHDDHNGIFAGIDEKIDYAGLG